VYPVKHDEATVNKFETAVGAEHAFYPILQGVGTPETI